MDWESGHIITFPSVMNSLDLLARLTVKMVCLCRFVWGSAVCAVIVLMGCRFPIVDWGDQLPVYFCVCVCVCAFLKGVVARLVPFRQWKGCIGT